MYIKLDNDHKIKVESKANGIKVTFFEYYTVCGWRKLSADIFKDVESVEWFYGVEL